MQCTEPLGLVGLTRASFHARGCAFRYQDHVLTGIIGPLTTVCRPLPRPISGAQHEKTEARAEPELVKQSKRQMRTFHPGLAGQSRIGGSGTDRSEVSLHRSSRRRHRRRTAQFTLTASPRTGPISRWTTRSAISSSPVGSRLMMTSFAPFFFAIAGKPAAG